MITIDVEMMTLRRQFKEKEENLGNRIASLIGGEKLKGAGFGLKDVDKQKSNNATINIDTYTKLDAKGS